ncbi:BMP family ABC transporter substrate-binding protein [Acidihalobacter ferrooxydans]|uniref:BMP family ABC transporter substrate-binding protein n=1 Tax=Acidihalobacter ferrooxydans TaxID=1765967 RepID=A0A1P8UEK6_9GAMM|nr:BMP family ABC transporter substrate-binding protein [Acidihalobacter ferrooxydans]APZ42218.1 BMP family ABC transporter substrate-binding protein [Acidihalobacter ferrooxydans]
MSSRRDFLKKAAGLTAAGALGSLPLSALAAEGYYKIPLKKPLKIGFVYIDPIGNIGWSYQHELGRQYMDKMLAGQVESTFVENVSDARAEAVFRQLASSGHQLIFTTSFSYMNPTLKVAKQFPNVIFEQATGFKTAPNMGNYNARFYEAQYLTGLVAGAMTKSNKIGYILPFPIPEVYRVVDAFTIGLHEVNPKATVSTVWVNTWYDPSKEREAAQSLVASGADVIATHTDSPAPMQVAEAHGIYAIGQDSNQLKYGPKAQLTGVIDTWGPYYVETARRVLEGRWKPESTWGGLKSGMVELAPLSPVIPQETVDLVMKRKAEIEAGTFNIFSGPLYDQKGELKVAAGKALNDGDLLGLQWFVKGVEGKAS